MATKESRIIRTRNVQDGTISFLDKRSKKTVECFASALWPVELSETGDWPSYWAELPVIIRHLILHGINGKVGDTVAAKDKDAPKMMTASWEALVAGTWSQGGGGSPLDTAVVVLREMVSDLLFALGMKRVDSDKLCREDIRDAYLRVCGKTAKEIGGGTKAKDVFAIEFPKIEAQAKEEAERRDSSAPVGPAATDELKAALVAAKAAREAELAKATKAA